MVRAPSPPTPPHAPLTAHPRRPPTTDPQGVGDWVSSRAENDGLRDQHRALSQRFAAEPAKVRAEVAAKLVQEKGFEAGDAEELVGILGQPQHAAFFTNYVMAELAGSELPADAWAPARGGGVTFLSFLFFGSIPLWVYMVAHGVGYTNVDGSLAISAAATVLALTLLGFVQGSLTKQHRGKAALLMAANGSVACAAAYGLAYGIMEGFKVTGCA